MSKHYDKMKDCYFGSQMLSKKNREYKCVCGSVMVYYMKELPQSGDGAATGRSMAASANC